MRSESEPFCYRCFIEDLSDEELKRVLRERLTSLPEELRAPETHCRERLSACARCESLVNGLCAHCGCFVELRAAKRSGTCPAPGGSRWKL